MTVIRPNSISGINSITGFGGDINLFRADGTKADVPIVNNITAGVVTATKFIGPIEATTGTFSGNLGVGGVLTYEDVTNIDSVGVITARSTVSIADSIIHTGDTNTSLRFPAADTITAETGGSERFRITSAGRIGINETSPNATLHIKSPDAANNRLELVHQNDAANEQNQITFKNNTTQTAYIVSGKDGSNNNIGLSFGTGNTVRMNIDASGNVTKPNQPAFHAYGNNSWTQYTGADNTIKLLNSECNIGGHYKQSGTDEGKFVVPVNGTYYFYTTIYSGRTDNSQTDNNDYLAIYFYEDGNNLANKGGHHIRHYYNEGDRDSTSSMSYIRTCTAGEKFYVSVTCNGTGYRVYGGHSAFGGYLIG